MKKQETILQKLEEQAEKMEAMQKMINGLK